MAECSGKAGDKHIPLLGEEDSYIVQRDFDGASLSCSRPALVLSQACSGPVWLPGRVERRKP